HIERLGQSAFGQKHDQQDRRELGQLAAPARALRSDRLFLHAHLPVPPTVIRSIRSVGCPTPTATPGPVLPQVPIPGSRAVSLLIILMRWRSVGPLPINLAPFSGAPSLPFSIL